MGNNIEANPAGAIATAASLKTVVYQETCLNVSYRLKGRLCVRTVFCMQEREICLKIVRYVIEW